MGLGKQAKILSKQQADAVSAFLLTKRHGLRDQTIFLLSFKAGLRATEIAGLKWHMVSKPNGLLDDTIRITDDVSKGKSGRIIPLNTSLKRNLEKLLALQSGQKYFDIKTAFVINTERAPNTSAQAIVNMFQNWYKELGMIGCSSHSGRRTFITNAARKISTVGGSLKDVQTLAGHSSLAVTQRYIEGNSNAQKQIVEII